MWVSIDWLNITPDTTEQIINGLEDKIEEVFPWLKNKKKNERKWEHAATKRERIERISKRKYSKTLWLRIFQKWEFGRWHVSLDWKGSQCQVQLKNLPWVRCNGPIWRENTKNIKIEFNVERNSLLWLRLVFPVFSYLELLLPLNVPSAFWES